MLPPFHGSGHCAARETCTQRPTRALPSTQGDQYGDSPAMVKMEKPLGNGIDDASYYSLFRHGTSGNFLFLDGHVKGISDAGTFQTICKKEYNDPAILIGVWDKQHRFNRN